MSLSFRPVRRDEIAEFRRAILRVFGMDWPASDEEDERYVALLPPERTLAAFDGSRIVGTSGTFGLEMTVPGGSMPVAALTMVTVAQTHRRRGILRELMRLHVEAAASRGDAFSALWASEAPIYGRYGYGLASEHDVVEIDTRGFDIAPEHGLDSLELLQGDDVRRLEPLYAHLRRQRAGTISRSERWWAERHFRDPEFRRNGASARRCVIATRDGEPTGYVVYRQRPKMEHGVADGTVQLVELLARDAAAEASLWRYVTNIDLHPRLSAWCVPVDSPLRWMANDHRRVRRRRTDAIWVRICDVPKALGGRRYESDGEVCFALRDPLERVSGTYLLRVNDGDGHCERTDAKPELELSLDVLGSLYLGGVRAAELANASRLDGSLASRLDRIFTTARAPWCAEIF